MAKIISITIHTERLHNDRVWKQVLNFLRFVKKNNVKTTWFSINPNFVGYKYNEKKWVKTLCLQSIIQSL